MPYWADISPTDVPAIKVKPPGPKSEEMHGRASQYMKGYSSQVRLFPVSFAEGHGVTLTDVDGNKYIDFSSGIYVTSLGHCHPKVTEAVRKAAGTLMNCHDFTHPLKAKLLEKLAGITNLSGVQFYDSGTTAVEAGLRAVRAATGKFEFISFHRDFHGKTMGAVSLARVDFTQGMRAPGFFLVPRPYCYRCAFKLTYPDCGIHCIDYIRTVIEEETTNRVAGIVLEPVQGWALMADEILTCMGRTGKMFAMEHWDTEPDVMTIGKSFGNGFPITAMLISEKYKDVLTQISASTSYGGNPMACAAALAVLEVIEEEDILRRATELGNFCLDKMKEIKEAHPIIGDVRGLGCLLGMEVVKDRETKEPFIEAGQLIYKKAFEKGVAWIPAGHNLRMSPPLIMQKEIAAKALDIIEEAIAETEKELC